MNKQQSKIEIEKRLLSLLINEVDLIAEASQIISLHEVSEGNKPVFQTLFDLVEPNETNIFLALRDIKTIDFFELKNNYDIRNTTPNLLFHLSKKIKEVNNSIKLDQNLIALLEKNKMLKNLDEVKSDIVQINEDLEKEIAETQINSFSMLFNEVYQEIENEIKNKVKPITSSYFPSFNTLTSGVRSSNIIGLAGNFKSGKTSFATELLIDFAEQGIPVCLFSFELNKRESFSKIISYRTGINYNSLINPKSLTSEDIQELNRQKTKAENFPVYVYTDLMNITQIKSKMKMLKNKKGVKIFFIDYLGYIQSENDNFKSREREMTFFSVRLKQIAKELKVTIFVIAQLNRQGTIHSKDLAESISLARDCDYLFTIAPAEILKEELKLRDTKGKFIVTLDTSRHTEQGKYFIIGSVEKGLREMLKEPTIF